MNEPKPTEAVVAIDDIDRPMSENANPTLEQRRSAATAEARSKLAGKLPSGYADAMIRSDDEPKDAPKPPVISPAQAASMARALTSLTEHAGLARADAGEEVKNKVTPNSDQPSESKDDSKKDEDPVVTALGKLADSLGDLGKRLDKLEKRGDGDEEDGKPEALAADDDEDDDAKARRDGLRKRSALERADASEMTFKTENLFYDFQSRVDSIAGLYGIGHHAPKPMAGEKLRDYKRRCVRPWQGLSPAFKDVDLKVLAVADGAAFAVACDHILTAADKEARHPTKIPDGWLSERVEQRGGHTYTRFYGRPKAWMGQFMPQGRLVKNVRQVAPDGRIEGTLYQKG